jgi:hypothetical protein
MNLLLDPKLGGKLRLAIVFLTGIATVVSAVADTSTLPWVASLSVTLTAVIGALTHLTTIGDKP